MDPDSPGEPNTPGYEATDAHAVLIFLGGAGVILTVLLTTLGITLMFRALHHRDLAAQERTAADRVTGPVAATRAQFPEPRLQIAPQVDLAAWRAREDAELNGFGWIDRKAGVVRIPIERAMDLIVQRGLPVLGTPNAPKATRTPLDMQQARPLQREPTKESP